MSKERKTEQITFRCTPSERECLEREAMKFNMKLTTYVGDKICNGKTRISYARRKICTSLVTVGNYLDEISSVLDAEQSNYIPKELVLESLEKAKKEIATIWKY